MSGFSADVTFQVRPGLSLTESGPCSAPVSWTRWSVIGVRSERSPPVVIGGVHKSLPFGSVWCDWPGPFSFSLAFLLTFLSVLQNLLEVWIIIFSVLLLVELTGCLVVKLSPDVENVESVTQQLFCLSVTLKACCGFGLVLSFEFGCELGQADDGILLWLQNLLDGLHLL